MTTYLVTRHQGAIEWARSLGIEAVGLPHFGEVDLANLSAGDCVMGPLPIHLIAEVCARGARYYHIQMDLPASARGVELTADDMLSYGATLVEYHAHSIASAEAARAAYYKAYADYEEALAAHSESTEAIEQAGSSRTEAMEEAYAETQIALGVALEARNKADAWLAAYPTLAKLARPSGSWFGNSAGPERR